MKNNNSHRLSIFIILPIGFLFLFFSQKEKTNEQFDSQPNSREATVSLIPPTVLSQKQKGAHVFGELDSMNLQFLIRNNIEWVTLVPWGDLEDYNSPIIEHHNGDSLRIQQSDSIWLSQIELIHSAGFKIFIKPHIWISSPSDGKWRSDIFPTNEENWISWKKSYREFILHYANLAEQSNVEMFCIGTEFSRLSIEKTGFWKKLIQEIRSTYSGKITYAANWYNEYEKITFWDDLDYIGIQAYFPLVENKNPDIQQISKGWKKYFPSLQSIHKKYNRKILFTEIGYKSTADSAVKPWEWIDYSAEQDKSLSVKTQANCYESFFNTVWKKEWFEGMHIWYFRNNDNEKIEDSGKDSLDFIPLGKPAEQIIAKNFE